jgi:hypothetical protein
VGRGLAAIFLIALWMPADAWADDREFTALVQDVPASQGARYGAHDNLGNALEALKIIGNPQGGYLGVYQTNAGGVSYANVGTSTDLVHWKHRAVLTGHGAQPTITALSDKSYLVAYERDGGCIGSGAPGGTCIRLLHYPDGAALLAASPDRSVLIKRMLSACAEGTPNFYVAQLAPDLDHSTIRIGFHYSRNCKIDRQAAGNLVDLSSWVAYPSQDINRAVQSLGAWGDVNDRDTISYGGAFYRLIAGQLVKGDVSSSRIFLESTAYGAKVLDIHTHRGTAAFTNPTASWITTPNGTRGIVFTLFLPTGSAAPGEAGELIYYKQLPQPDPVIAAAGDIACDPTSSSFNLGLGTSSSCHAAYTSDILATRGLSAVLPLGDEQYDNGVFTDFLSSYDLSWGRLKGLSYPAVGNHEYLTPGAAGYFDYFNGASSQTGRAGERGRGYYSFDVGTWHLIALNSNCGQVGGCSAGSPEETWLRNDLGAHPAACTLAYWHHPRFSSGNHGDNTSVGPLWQALYDRGADVVLNGHDHDYERFAPQTATGAADSINGIREFVVGTGGKSHSSVGQPNPNSEVRNADTYGVLRLTLRSSSYDWMFLPEAGKTFTDFGSGTCH